MFFISNKNKDFNPEKGMITLEYHRFTKKSKWVIKDYKINYNYKELDLVHKKITDWPDSVKKESDISVFVGFNKLKAIKNVNIDKNGNLYFAVFSGEKYYVKIKDEKNRRWLEANIRKRS